VPVTLSQTRSEVDDDYYPHMRKGFGLLLVVCAAVATASCANQDLVDAYDEGWTVGSEVHENDLSEKDQYSFCDRAVADEFGYEESGDATGRAAAVLSAYSNGCLNGAEGGSGEISRSELGSLVSDP